MITEKTVYDQITILEDGQLMLRRARVIMDDGVEISRLYHREVAEPDQDAQALPARVKDVAALVWTPDVVKDYTDKKAAREAAKPENLSGSKK